ASPAQQALEIKEEFIWDDLALLWRNGTSYAVEPHPNGGTPVAVFERPDTLPTFLLSDILGTTLAAIKPDRVEIIPLTAFGKPVNVLVKPATVSPNPLSSGSGNGVSQTVPPQTTQTN
ncbi:MAG TPA: hypothetical protein VIS74_00055, partial [Chthoniobacterales bacterium]